ncbi:MAG: hypothetical protein K2G84_02625 [Muribaculaceae bacterium]|nr:hypothetical protein [Muribaculaceae bacterium]
METEEIRRLIRLFYDGESTPAQESQLLRLLEEADESQLPEDMLEEKRILMEICSREVPAGLGARLEDMIDNLAAVDNITGAEVVSREAAEIDSPQTDSPARWRMLAWWSASVAAVAIFVVMYLPLAHFDAVSLRHPSSSGDMASAMVIPEIGLMARDLSIACAETEAFQTPAPVKLVPSAPVSRKHKTVPKKQTDEAGRGSVATSCELVAQVATDNGKHREVTDPDEANALLDRAFSRVYRNLAIARTSMASASLPVGDDTRIIDNIFKQEEKL